MGHGPVESKRPAALQRIPSLSAKEPGSGRGTAHATFGSMSSCLRRSVLAATAWVLVGCLSPTLPLPPPGEPSVTDQGDGTYMLTGSVPPNSEVYALNTRTMFIDGQATGESGEYAFTLEAQPRDPIELWYSSGTRESQLTSFEIPAP